MKYLINILKTILCALCMICIVYPVCIMVMTFCIFVYIPSAIVVYTEMKDITRSLGVAFDVLFVGVLGGVVEKTMDVVTNFLS